MIESAVLALRPLRARRVARRCLGPTAASRSPAGARSAVGWPRAGRAGRPRGGGFGAALAAGYWLAAGIRGPVTAAGPQILPPFVAAASAGPDQARTLVLRRDGAALSYTVLRSTDPVLGEPELTGDSSAASELDGVVASLAAAAGGDGGDAGQALRQFDIGYILLPAPVDQALASQLAGAAGLIRLTSAPAYDLWQVAGTVARASVIAPGGAAVPVPSGPVGVNTVLAASTSGTLVLAEAAGGWSAVLNGRPLAPLARPVDGWAQGFVLPAGGGRLVITRDDTARDLSLGAEAVAVLLVLALALPGTRSATAAATAAAAAPRRRRRSPRASAPRRPGGGGTEPRDPGQRAVPARRGRLRHLPPAPRARCRRRNPPGYAADAAQWSGPDPAAGDQAEAEPGSAPAPAPAAATPKRPRGGQHAARHGKPPRRGARAGRGEPRSRPRRGGRRPPGAAELRPHGRGPPAESGDRS